MGRVTIITLLAILTFPVPASAQRTSRNSERSPSARAIAARILPSVVTIRTMTPEGKPVALGSGFFWTKDAVITSLHVFRRASKAEVVSSTGEVTAVRYVRAVLIYPDLCIVELDRPIGSEVAFNETRPVAVGDDVYVAGNPQGLAGTFTKGIISALRREEGLIQIDAAISPGSSGGPVVNAYGEVIGIVASTIVGGQNLNFAVRAEALLDEKSCITYKAAPVVVAGSLSLRDRDQDKLVGAVRSVNETVVVYGSRSDREGRFLSRELKTYNLYGDMIWMELQGHDTIRIAYEYDGAGLLRRKI
jgi:hypothetical protein